MKELNDENFKEEIRNQKLTLVDFYASWCGPCELQSGVLNKLYTSRANLNFNICKVNVDEARALSEEYEIESIPTLIIFKNGEMVRKLVGLTREEEILEIMSEYED